MICDPTLDNIYQQAILTIEERETKLLGTFYRPSL
jgi:hypothetical protein